MIARKHHNDGVRTGRAQIPEGFKEKPLRLRRGIQTVENVAGDNDGVDLTRSCDIDQAGEGRPMLIFA